MVDDTPRAEDVERFDLDFTKDADAAFMKIYAKGSWVRYSDHRTALDAAEARTQAAVAVALKEAADAVVPYDDAQFSCRSAILALITPDATAALTAIQETKP